MHRVELKEKIRSLKGIKYVFVPNAPCGVERRQAGASQKAEQGAFLMHRVELKDEVGSHLLPILLRS